MKGPLPAVQPQKKERRQDDNLALEIAIKTKETAEEPNGVEEAATCCSGGVAKKVARCL